MADVMPDKVRVTFAELARSTEGQDEARLVEFEAEITASVANWPKSADYMAPANYVERLFDSSFPSASPAKKSRLQICLAARLALKLPQRLAPANLTDAILRRYPEAFSRMLEEFQTNAGTESFLPLGRYIRFLLVQTVPCGAQVVDLNSSVPFTSAVASIPRMRDVRPFARYLLSGGTGTWFRSHTDTGYLTEFNKEGFDRYYADVAALLKRHPAVKGMAGTSWFYDPALAEVSPRLAYLAAEQLNGGAYLIRHGTTRFDIDSATKTSPTRRQLFEEGKYVPTSYSVIWPRKQLIAWADRRDTRRSPDVHE